MQLRPYQVEAIEGVERNLSRGYKAPLLIMATGMGKAQPLDAKVLTPTGWKRMGDVKIGEELINPNGGVAKIINIYPQGEVDIYKVTFSDGSSTECCADHLWEFTTRSRKSKGLPPFIMPLKAITNFMGSYKDNLYIPMLQKADFTYQEVPLDPYILGILLGDGSVTNGKVHVTTADEEIRQALLNSLPEGHSLRITPSRTSSITEELYVKGVKQKNKVLDIVRQLGIAETTSYTKFIPSIYLWNSKEIRIALLQGLMDTDGTVASGCSQSVKTRPLSYSTSSQQLKDDVCTLVQTLGGSVRVRTKRPKYVYKGEVKTGAISYTVQINLPPDIEPFRLSRKANIRDSRLQRNAPTRYFKTIEYVGKKEAQCIKLDSQNELYVTDNCIVTHNTVVSHGLISRLAPINEKRTLFLVHLQDLVRQTKRAFTTYEPSWSERRWTAAGRPGVGIVMGETDQPDARVVIGTPQTLGGEKNKKDYSRLENIFKYGQIDNIIIDEAHMSIVDSYMGICEVVKQHNKDVNIFGFTATAWREDGKGLNNLFDVISCNYNLQYGISHHYLCPILDPLQIETHIDFDYTGDVENEENVAAAIDVRNWAEIVLKGYVENGQNRLAVGFMPSVNHSREFTRYAQSQGIPCAHVDSEMVITPDGQEIGSKGRYAIYEWFGADKDPNQPRILANYNILTTGWDCPATSCILWSRPTTNSLIMTQAIGRGTRLHPSKEDLLILDYAIKGLKVASVSSIAGLAFDADGETAEKEEEELAEGDIRDAMVKKGETMISGTGIVVKVGKLIGHSKNAWYVDHRTNEMSLSCGEDHILYVQPPWYTLAKRIEEGLVVGEAALDLDPTNAKKEAFYRTLQSAYEIFNNYSAWKINKNDKGYWKLDPTPLLIDDNPMSLFDRLAPVEDRLMGDNAVLTKKHRQWRRKEPSIKQIELLQRLHCPDTPESMGMAAQLIIHYIAAPKINKCIDDIRNSCKKYGVLDSELLVLDEVSI